MPTHLRRFVEAITLVVVLLASADFAQAQSNHPADDPWRTTTPPSKPREPVTLDDDSEFEPPPQVPPTTPMKPVTPPPAAKAPPAQTPPPEKPKPVEAQTVSTSETPAENEMGLFCGDRHFRNKPRPIGSPLYFEDPFINTDLRLGYFYNKVPDDSRLKGGDFNVYTMQARVALTDRLQFLVGDGGTQLDSPVLKDDSGWNDLTLGLKYAAYVDHEEDLIVSTGLKWRLSNGHADTLSGGVDELTPFVSAFKGWGKFNLLADVEGRIAMDEHRGNHLLCWNLQASYEIIERLFFPLFEFHGVHYLSNGDRNCWDVGGLDIANIGSNEVAGHSSFWAGVGARWNIVDHVSWGTVWEFPLQNPDNNDLFDYRVSTNLIFTF